MHSASTSSCSPENSDRNSSSLKPRGHGGEGFVDLRHLTLVALFARHLGQRLGVVDVLHELFEGLDVGDRGGQFAGDATGEVLVVPQIGARRFGLELRPAMTEVVDPQVLLGLAEPPP